MFTGLIEDIGTLRQRSSRGSDVSLQLETSLPMSDVRLGDSIAVNGVCLTVTSKDARSFSADVSQESLRHSALGSVRVGDRVHLERALLVGGRLGGHFVQGHVDGVGRLTRRTQVGRAWDLWVELPSAVLAELVPKGSIAVDGVSLTVNELSATAFRLTIVPHTENQTLLLERPIGASLNIETDMIGKYVRRFVQGGREDRMGELLTQFGFNGREEN